VPLAIFKREKEIARRLEFDGLYIAEQPEDDDIKSHWDKLVISAKWVSVWYTDVYQCYCYSGFEQWIDIGCIEFNSFDLNSVQNGLIPSIKNKSGKYYIHAVVPGIIQLIKLHLSFSIDIKVFTKRVEGVSI